MSAKKKMKYDVSTRFVNPMAFSPRFQHITEHILMKMDIETLKTCRMVSKIWLDCIDNQKILWQTENGNRAFLLACLNSHSRMAETLIKNSTRFNIDLDFKSTVWGSDFTGFYHVCKNGNSMGLLACYLTSRE